MVITLVEEELRQLAKCRSCRFPAGLQQASAEEEEAVETHPLVEMPLEQQRGLLVLQMGPLVEQEPLVLETLEAFQEAVAVVVELVLSVRQRVEAR